MGAGGDGGRRATVVVAKGAKCLEAASALGFHLFPPAASGQHEHVYAGSHLMDVDLEVVGNLKLLRR